MKDLVLIAKFLVNHSNFRKILFLLFVFSIFGNFGLANDKNEVFPGKKSAELSPTPAPPRIAGMVWEDVNGNGIQDGELGIAGILVELLDGTGMFSDDTNTDGNGEYAFEDLAPGNYIIRFNLTGTYLYTEANIGGDDNIDSDANPISNGETPVISLLAGSDIDNIDAGYFLPASVGDYVWEDLDGNGEQNEAGTGIDGVTVTIDGFTGTGTPYTDTDITAGGGFYLFDDIPPGDYALSFSAPAGYFLTQMDNAADDFDSDPDPLNANTTITFPVLSDDVQINWDAGFWQYGSIGDFVWEDLDGNGIQDAGEPGIAGVTVDINGTTAAGTPYSDTQNTDGAGNYLFDNLEPGNYTITFLLPAGYGDYTLLDQGGDDMDSDADPATGPGETVALDLESNQDYVDFDAGFYRFVTISNYCWEDTNGNGVQDAFEVGLGNVSVTATRTSDALTFMTTSNGAGNYEFLNLPPGEYTFEFQNGGYINTWQDQGSDDLDSDPNPTTGVTDPFPYESGDSDDSVDAGFYRYSRIGDYTWRDQNADGIQDFDEGPLPDVEATLTGLTGHGVPVNDNVISDGAGFYEFTDLPPGEYTIEFDGPPSYAESPFQATGDPTNDSDAPISDPITIESGDLETTIDAGYYVEPPADCDDHPANLCEVAAENVLCDIENIHDFCTVMLEPWDPGIPNPLCPSGGFAHNPSWFAFVASQSTVELIIHANPCTVEGNQEIGIQYGIYNDCGPPWDPVICEESCEEPGDITVMSNNFIPGEDYYFFIDGCNGTICTYWIEIVQGGGFYAVTDPTGISCNDEDGDCATVCLGSTIEFTLDETDDAVDYIWTIDGVIDGNLTEQVISIEFLDEGTYQICGYGENVCDQSDEVCIEVTVEAEPDVDLGVFEVCSDVLNDVGIEPDDWNGGIITAPGIYTIETASDFGCIFNQTVEVIELPNEMTVIDTFACRGDVINYLGQDYDENVENLELVDAGGSVNGCDRFIDFTATFIDMEFASLDEIVCLGGSEFQLSVFEVATYPLTPDDIYVQWYLDGVEIGTPVNTFPFTIQVNEEGIYSAEVYITVGENTCNFLINDDIEILYEDLFPEEPEQNTWLLEYCNNVNDTLAYAIFNPNFLYTYEWTYPDDVNYAFYDVDLGTLFIDWFGSEGGEVCVQAINDCGESTILCEDILISPGPNAEFEVPDTLCRTDLVEITYTGTAGSGANYDWNFGGGIDTSGNNDQGAGPYVMTWGSSGPKVISLTVEENGCFSSIEEQTIFLQPPLQEPLVNCVSNQSEINFTWNNVVNASGYDVTLIEGTAGTQNLNSYLVTGLDPLDSVSIVVTALSETYCPPQATDTITCYALDCPDVTVDILAVDTSICYEGGGDPFILDHLITPDDIGVITWSGNGIIDEDTGLFHPDSAGYGSHQIRINYIVDNCSFNDEAVINIYEQPTADFTTSSDSICNTDQLIINYVGNMSGGNATWEFDNPTNITGMGLNQRRAMWDEGGWKTISLQVESNGCISEVVTKDVYVEEAMPPIDINCETSVDSIVFSWEDNTMLEAYQIYIDGVLVDSVDILSWTIDGLSEGDEVELYLVGINSGICANPTGIKECQAEACPVFSTNVTPAIDSICLVDGISPIQFISNLTGATQAGEESWTGDGIDPNTGLFDPVAAGIGTHTIGYQYAEGSCDIDTSFTITILEQPVSNFSVDKTTICITDVITLTNNVFNNAFDYNWGFDNATINQLSDEVFELSWGMAGTYDLTLQVNNILCTSDLLTQQVVVEPELTAPDIMCDPSTQSIQFGWTEVDCAAAYQLFVDGELVIETTDNAFLLEDLNSDQSYSVELVVVSECACPNVSTTLNCVTDPCPNIELSIDELPSSICFDEISGDMSLHATIVGTQGGDIQWSGNSISNSGDAGLINMDQLTPGEYYFTVEYELDNCSYDFSDVLTIHPPVDINTNGTDPSCHDLTDGTLVFEASGGTAPFSYLMDGVLQDTNAIDNLGPGNYSLEISDINGCNVSGQVSLINPPLVVPRISGPEVLQENQAGTFSLALENQVADANYTWYKGTGEILCNEDCGNVVELSIQEETEICVDVSYNEDKCSETACFTVRFEEIVDVYIPNVFSPNNDDNNDIFFIKSDESVTLVKTMHIFDRWGEMIFNRTNFAPNESDLGWDGKYNGKTLMPGVYVYDIVIITKENKEFRYTGDITLIR